jgi:hypothetical protein
VPFHARTERFACIVTHRRAGKTVACIHDLQRAALRSETVRPRLAYLSPFSTAASSSSRSGSLEAGTRARRPRPQ